jgi:hypothetical protein
MFPASFLKKRASPSFAFSKFPASDTMPDQGKNVALAFLQFVARFLVADGLADDASFAARPD